MCFLQWSNVSKFKGWFTGCFLPDDLTVDLSAAQWNRCSPFQAFFSHTYGVYCACEIPFETCSIRGHNNRISSDHRTRTKRAKHRVLSNETVWSLKKEPLGSSVMKMTVEDLIVWCWGLFAVFSPFFPFFSKKERKKKRLKPSGYPKGHLLKKPSTVKTRAITRQGN